MKTRFLILLIALCATSALHAQGTAFTYEGRLKVGSGPANGLFDMTFALCYSASGPGQLGATVTHHATEVTDGLFNVTLDFGEEFPGADRWLEIAVRPNGPGAFTTLTPRQKLTPTPYAITAANVAAGGGISGRYTNWVSFENLTNSFNGWFSGNGEGLDNVNAQKLGGLSPSDFWKAAGNAGTTPGVNFLGTTDNQSLTLKVNNKVALQFMPGTTVPNVVGGMAGNLPSVIASGVSGAVIAGGNAPSGGVTGLGGGDFQAVYDNDGTVGGGFGNKVGNGNADVTDAAFATVAGGVFNSAANYAATVAGGDGNFSGGLRSFIGGGFGNAANGSYGTVPGGFLNTASGEFSFAAGRRAKANHPGSFVWADSQDSDFASTANNQFNIRAQGGVRLNTDTSLLFGNTGTSILSPDQGGAIELGSSTIAAAAPYIDFHYGIGAAQNYNVRIVNDGTETLSIFRFASGTRMAQFSPAGLSVNGTFVSTSDRNAKENFRSVNGYEVLDKVVALPLSRWNYKADKASEHIGPMAQDFYAAFGVGPDDKHIATVDADGVALAAIQGLNQRLEETRKENAELKQRLEKLERLLANK